MPSFKFSFSGVKLYARGQAVIFLLVVLVLAGLDYMMGYMSFGYKEIVSTR